MSPREALAHALWASADYNSGHAPGEGALLVIEFLARLGFEVREIK